MTSLSAHLRRPDDHAQLPFHPQCPLCRQERLSGRLVVEPLVSRRTQAAMTAGLLALTSVAPTAAFAAEGDREGEGGADPAAVAPADVDLGPGDPDLGEDAGAAPADDGDDVPPASPPAGTAPAPSTPAATTPAASAPTPKPSAPTAKAPRATPPAAAPAPNAPASAPADGAPTANAAPPGLPAEGTKPAAELPGAFGDRQAVAAPTQGTPRAAQPHRRVKLANAAAAPRHRQATDDESPPLAPRPLQIPLPLRPPRLPRIPLRLPRPQRVPLPLPRNARARSRQPPTPRAPHVEETSSTSSAGANRSGRSPAISWARTRRPRASRGRSTGCGRPTAIGSRPGIPIS